MLECLSLRPALKRLRGYNGMIVCVLWLKLYLLIYALGFRPDIYIYITYIREYTAPHVLNIVMIVGVYNTRVLYTYTHTCTTANARTHAYIHTHSTTYTSQTQTYAHMQPVCVYCTCTPSRLNKPRSCFSQTALKFNENLFQTCKPPCVPT